MKLKFKIELTLSACKIYIPGGVDMLSDFILVHFFLSSQVLLNHNSVRALMNVLEEVLDCSNASNNLNVDVGSVFQ